MFETAHDVVRGLREAGDAADPVLVQMIWLSTKMQKPILIEGPPVTGKTYLAKAFAAAAKTDLIRLQCFEGITEKQAIRSLDETLQRLVLDTQAEAWNHQWEKLRDDSRAAAMIFRAKRLFSVFLPACIEKSVWDYFSEKAERKGVGLSQFLTDVLKRDIEINAALN
jgi:hypothetical protein